MHRHILSFLNQIALGPLSGPAAQRASGSAGQRLSGPAAQPGQAATDGTASQ